MTNFDTSGKTVSVESEREHADGQRMMADSRRMSAAMVDANHPDCRGMTLEQEEKAIAREYEIGRTRWGRSMDDREERTREVVTDEVTGIPEETRAVDWTADLDVDTKSLIREQAERIASETDRGWTVQAIMQKIAQKIKGGKSANAAILDTLEDSKTAAGVFVEPHLVGTVDREELHVKGEVVQIWEDTHESIHQAGLIEGPKDTVKFTDWVKSGNVSVQNGDEIRIYNVKRNWYKGRPSVALTHDSRIEFVEKAPRDDEDDQAADTDDAVDPSSQRSPGERGGAGLKQSDLHDGLFNPDSPDFEAPPTSGSERDGTETWAFPDETHEQGRLIDYPHWRTILE